MAIMNVYICELLFVFLILNRGRYEKMMNIVRNGQIVNLLNFGETREKQSLLFDLIMLQIMLRCQV